MLRCHRPVEPSISSRRMSACPAWRPVSSLKRRFPIRHVFGEKHRSFDKGQMIDQPEQGCSRPNNCGAHLRFRSTFNLGSDRITQVVEKRAQRIGLANPCPGRWDITAAPTRRCHGGSPSSLKNDEEASFLDRQYRSFRTHADPASNFAVAAKAGLIAGITAPNAGRAQVEASATCRPRTATAAADKRDGPRSN